MNNKIHILNLKNYVSPQVIESQSKEWVTYGKNNSYFQYLIDRSRGSATNGAVNQSIIDIIYGNGVTSTNKAQKPDEWAQFLSIFKEEDIRRAVNDLKRMGQYAFQIQYQGRHKSIMTATHIPVELLAPEKLDDEEEIQAYYYTRDWNKPTGENLPVRIPAFGTSNEGLEILYVKPYRSGLFYFSNVDYQGGLQYAELEEEIGNYHISNIQNGLAPSMILNFNNGVPSEEIQEEIVRDINRKYQGSSNTGKWIIAFNDNKENAGSIDAVPLSDAADQYQFLSDESARKILVSHRVTSPLLLGISTSTGFGSNADELKTASLLFESLVINPFRQLLLEGIEKVTTFNKLSLDFEFESLNPFDTSVKQEGDSGVVESTPQASEKELEAQAGLRGSVGGVQGILGIQASVASGLTSFESAVNMLVEIYGFTREVAINLLGTKTAEAAGEGVTLYDETPSWKWEDGDMFDALEGEEEDLKEWDLIDEREVDYEKEDVMDEDLKEANLSVQLANTGKAHPDKKSTEDGEGVSGTKYKVRYQYSPLKISSNSRPFCKMMVNAKKIYRKEDIIKMGSQPVNKGWGPKGNSATYSIWLHKGGHSCDTKLYKGGGGCHHFWMRKTYARRQGDPIKSIAQGNADQVSVESVKRDGFRPKTNESIVSIRPSATPTGQFLDGRDWTPKTTY